MDTRRRKVSRGRPAGKAPAFAILWRALMPLGGITTPVDVDGGVPQVMERLEVGLVVMHAPEGVGRPDAVEVMH